MKIAVLAVQGAFIEHEKMLESLGAETIELRQKSDLEQDFDGIVLPGGESTVQGKLLKELDMYDALKEKIEQTQEIYGVKPVDCFISKIDGTRKYLFELYDGNIIESVLMKYKHGNSVCISSQAGCRMGCKFCASTLGGLDRNLTPSEMLSQIYYIQRDT